MHCQHRITRWFFLLCLCVRWVHAAIPIDTEQAFELPITRSGPTKLTLDIGTIDSRLLPNTLFHIHADNLSLDKNTFALADHYHDGNTVSFPLFIDTDAQQLWVTVKPETIYGKLGALGGVLPETLPLLLLPETTWLPIPTHFSESFFRWSHQLYLQDITAAAREILQDALLADQSNAMAQCTADFAESIALFKGASYESLLDETLSTSNTLRRYMMVPAMKRAMDCLSTLVFESIKSAKGKGFYRKVPYSDNIDVQKGMAKLVVGYSFNLTNENTAPSLMALLNLDWLTRLNARKNIERSIIKASQSTIHSGFELIFRGTTGNSTYAKSAATAVGIGEALARLTALHFGNYGTFQLRAVTARTEAMVLSWSDWCADHGELSPTQQLMIGFSLPALLYGALTMAGADESTLWGVLANAFYESVVRSQLTYMVKPSLHALWLQGLEHIAPTINYLFNMQEEDWLYHGIDYHITLSTTPPEPNP